MGCIFSYRLSVLKLLAGIEHIILICGEQADASAGDFTKGFLSITPHKVCLGGIPGGGLEGLEAIEMGTLWQL